MCSRASIYTSITNLVVSFVSVLHFMLFAQSSSTASIVTIIQAFCGDERISRGQYDRTIFVLAGNLWGRNVGTMGVAVCKNDSNKILRHLTILHSKPIEE